MFNCFKKIARKSTQAITDFDFTFGLGDIITVPDEMVKNKKILKDKKDAVKKKASADKS